MPSSRRRNRGNAKEEVGAGVLAYLCDRPEEECAALGMNPFSKFVVGFFDVAWQAVKIELLREWCNDHPGTRPRTWWVLDAPREPIGSFPGDGDDGTHPEARKFIGGAGCPAWLVLNDARAYGCGLPGSWAGFDANDPPTFESQAAYLKRHSLLTAGELKRLTASDYEETEVLDAGCEVALFGPYDGPNAEGVAWLNAMDERIRARIARVRAGKPAIDQN